MKKRLAKTIKPGFSVFFVVFLLYTILCAAFSIWLSIGGVILCALLYLAYYLREMLRHRALAQSLGETPIPFGAFTSCNANALPLPALAALVTTGEILWSNELLLEEIGWGKIPKRCRLAELSQGFDTSWLAEGKKEDPVEIKIGEKYFHVYGSSFPSAENEENLVMLLYLLPCTDVVYMREKYMLSRPAVAVISIDNYEEMMKNASDSEKSLVLAEIDKRISDWTRGSGALLRKYDRDKYIFVLEEHTLQDLVLDKFSVLDKVRDIQNREGIIATLSIGIGKEGETLQETYDFACLALETALSRGGDQAIIKNKHTFEFFGGLSRELEKRTKVKSRVIANTLSQLIRDSSQVLVMGHANSDMDSFGAAIGMVCAVRCQEKPVHVVINSERTLAGELLHRMEQMPEYKGLFMNPDEAMVVCDANTLLIVVDTNRPDFVESPPLLESINKVAVIDHHRRAASYIENATVNLHEPYASSACELVTELLQYMVPNRTILLQEAECLLAGIYLDTKGFSVKAGVRTFEAAAYLKRAGADMVEVKKLFQSSFDEYMVRQKIITSAHTVGNGIVVAVSRVETSRAIAGKAADELLDIIGVRASIVVTRNGQEMVVSARSLGKINVQIIMEKLGGGGNLSSAGAQLGNITPEEAEAKINEAVAAYCKENV